MRVCRRSRSALAFEHYPCPTQQNGSVARLLNVVPDVGTPRRWAMIAVIALSASVSCGELSHPQPTPSVITFTLTPTGCTAEGVGVLLSPKFDAIVVNNTSSVAVFNFRRLLDGHTYSE